VFATICTQGRQRLFGTVRDGEVMLTPAGVQATERWRQIPVRFPDVLIDAFIVMPDHIHAILMIRSDPAVEQETTVGDVVRWFKSTMFADYTTGTKVHGWAPYDRQLWQRNFYDRIIRTDHELDRIRQYIEGNPARWQAQTEQELRI
jgi:REP element-mobilizing transposase RayT